MSGNLLGQDMLYEGECRNGCYHGFGRLIAENGTHYIG